LPPSLLVSSVQNYTVALLDEQLCCHAAEPVGRTCDEDARHDLWPLVYLQAAGCGHSCQ
jgi:hypothetical protein